MHVMREPRVQPPLLDQYSDLPLFNTKAVVHHTGVPAPTLRAWERRYGILSPRRGDNDYRLYSERDMATVTWLRERVDNGMTISQAIALLRSYEPARRRRRSRPMTAGAYEDEAPAIAAPQVAEPNPTFALPELGAALLDHLVRLDEAGAQQLIAQALAIYPVEQVCVDLFTPVLEQIGQLWEEGEVSVTTEHFAASVIRAQLEGLFRSGPQIIDGPLLLVGCAPGELHEIGALMLALFVRRAGMRVVYLGQNVEIESLATTVATTAPAVVLLSASLRPHAEVLVEVGDRLRHLAGPRTQVYFGGRAFREHPELAERVGGEYLGVNAVEAVREVKRRLTA